MASLKTLKPPFDYQENVNIVLRVGENVLKILDLLENRKTYRGDAIERGGTSIKGAGAAPAVKWLYSSGAISEGMRVLDYGAGKYGRNSDFLRGNGCDVYAYDPYNGSNVDGWEGVSNSLPSEKFDVVFSSFVLNVVPEQVEDDIIQECFRFSRKVYHITRNMDIFDTVKKALNRGDRLVVDFFIEEYADGDEELISAAKEGNLKDKTILDFCHFGVKTSRGFQRIPVLEDKGFSLVKKTNGFKIYSS